MCDGTSDYSIEIGYSTSGHQWSGIKHKTLITGVAQGYVLHRLLYVLDVNDIIDGMQFNIADGTLLYIAVEDPLTTNRMLNGNLQSNHD